MPPFSVSPSTTAPSELPSATATVQRLETVYGPQVQNSARQLADIYFSHLTTLQVISVLLTSAFIAGIVYLVIKTQWLAVRIDRFQDVIMKKDGVKKLVKSSWEDIEKHFFAGDDNDLRIAIIEADTLLDEALRGAGIQGAQLGERLRKVNEAQLPNIEDVWQVHKLRNRIAHETDFMLKRDLAERALTVYEKALQHLGFLEPGADLLQKEASPVDPSGPTGASH